MLFNADIIARYLVETCDIEKNAFGDNGKYNFKFLSPKKYKYDAY